MCQVGALVTHSTKRTISKVSDISSSSVGFASVEKHGKKKPKMFIVLPLPMCQCPNNNVEDLNLPIKIEITTRPS